MYPKGLLWAMTSRATSTSGEGLRTNTRFAQVQLQPPSRTAILRGMRTLSSVPALLLTGFRAAAILPGGATARPTRTWQKPLTTRVLLGGRCRAINSGQVYIPIPLLRHQTPGHGLRADTKLATPYSCPLPAPAATALLRR